MFPTVNGKKEEAGETPLYHQVTLDEVWREAERIGRITVERGWSKTDGYKARIMFERRSGTTVWAEGVDQDVVFALQKAIVEARALQG